MGTEVRLDFSREFAVARRNFQKKMTAGNFRFAMAKTLTEMAQKSQAAVRADLPRKFILRRPWVANGIRIKTATKSGLWAAIYSLDSGGRRPFMTRQEFGGIKSPDGGNHIAVPWKTAFPDKRKLIPDVMKPKALLGDTVQVNNAKAGVTTYRQSGVRRERKVGGKVRRVWVAVSSPFKTLKVTGKRAGIQWILIKKGNKYIPAWLLINKTKIKKTQFLLVPTVRTINNNLYGAMTRNMYEAIKPKGKP